ncbi:gamma-tubulin complex component 3 [Anaeramoeba ignava]|uniref:Gamma-tubulin complex component 3 n=1 Tax=Anaeramoeba ignava TaxID=1746090 RepID=A0A9Q0R614_ANAIG|nr:gamma-tubulin complex component 3 [Anaeramoeba ignava]
MSNKAETISKLIYKLVRYSMMRFGKPEQKTLQKLFSFSIQACSSNLTSTIELNEPNILDLIKKKLSQSNSQQSVIEATDKYRKVKKIGILPLNSLNEIIYLFHILSGLPPEKPKYLTETSKRYQQKDTGIQTQTYSNTNENFDQNKTEPIKDKNMKNGDFIENQPKITENMLVKEIIFVLQGIEGKMIHFDHETQTFSLSKRLEISRTTRHLVNKIAELGWIYTKIKKYLEEREKQNELGLIERAFCSSIKDEMNDYYQQISVFDSQVLDFNTQIKNNEINGGENLVLYPFTSTAIFYQKDAKNEQEKDIQNSIASPPMVVLQGDTGPTLRRIYHQARPLISKFKVIAALTDAIKDQNGGAILSVIYNFVSHGDPEIKSMMSRILTKSSKPLFRIAKKWITLGRLDDPFNEFFVQANENVQKDVFWRQKYQIRDKMVPKFMSIEIATKIMVIGKSINFLKHCCRIDQKQLKHEIISQRYQSENTKNAIVPLQNTERQFSIFTEISEHMHNEHKPQIQFLHHNPKVSQGEIPEHKTERDFFLETNPIEARSEMELSQFYSEMEALENLVQKLSKKMNKEVLKIIFRDFKLLDHCTAIQNFILFGRGDFIFYLMDSLGEDLSRPANTIFKHNLLGILDTAVRQSSANDEDEDIIRRLDIKLLEPTSKDSGWDIFSLDYKVGSPINTILTQNAMKSYLKIFNFLWRLKRAEFCLSETWRWHMVSSSLFSHFPGIFPQLHRCYLLRNEMIHFIYHLQHYVLFEVLQCSWEHFLEEAKQAPDLDSVIAAHEEYLNEILDKSMLTPSSELHETALEEIGKISRNRIIDNQNLNEWETHRKLERQTQKLEKLQKMKKSKKIRFFSPQQDSIEKQGVSTPRTEKLVKSLNEQLDSIEIEFQLAFEGFQDLLSQYESSRPILRFLTYRLDFNEFYEKRMAREMKAARIAHTIQSTAKKSQHRTQKSYPGKKLVFHSAKDQSNKNDDFQNNLSDSLESFDSDN